MFALVKYTTEMINMREADIPEDRLIFAEVMYDVFYLNKKKNKKNTIAVQMRKLIIASYKDLFLEENDFVNTLILPLALTYS